MPESASRQRARSDRAAGAGPAPRLPPARFARPSPTRVAPAPKVGDSSPRPSHRSPCPLAVRRGHHANHRSPPERSRTEVLFDDLAVVPTCDRAKVGGMVFPSAITKGPFMVPVNLAIEHVPLAERDQRLIRPVVDVIVGEGLAPHPTRSPGTAPAPACCRRRCRTRNPRRAPRASH